MDEHGMMIGALHLIDISSLGLIASGIPTWQSETLEFVGPMSS
jgi:hypothetical protein